MSWYIDLFKKYQSNADEESNFLIKDYCSLSVDDIKDLCTFIESSSFYRYTLNKNDKDAGIYIRYLLYFGYDYYIFRIKPGKLGHEVDLYMAIH